MYRTLWERMEKYRTLYSNTDLLLNRTKTEETFAYIEEVSYLEQAIENNCNLAVTDDRFFKANFGFPVQRDFPYTKEFNEK